MPFSIESPAPGDPDTGRVHEFNAHEVDFGIGNRPVTPESVSSDLLPSVEKYGQQQPGIVTDNPEKPGRLMAAAGNRRLMCCRILGIKFKAIRVHGPITMVDIIRIRLTENVIRKTMTKDEIVADILQHIEITGCTQESAAEAVGFSCGYVSKLLSPNRRLIPELHGLGNNPKVTRDVLRILASMPTPDMQKKLAERVLADIEQHGRAKRNVIERVALEMKGGNRPRRVPRAEVSKDGARIVYPGDWTWERLAKFLGDLYERAKREAKNQAEGKVVHPITCLQQLV